MIDQIINAIPPEIIRGLAVGAATVPCVWGFIERVLPNNSKPLTNHLTNIGGNALAYFGLHGAGVVAFGVGWRGWLAAGVFSLLSSGLTVIFHEKVMKTLAPGLMRPSGG